MDKYFSLEFATSLYSAALQWVDTNVLVKANAAQLGGMLIAVLAALAIAPWLRRIIARKVEARSAGPRLTRLANTASELALPIAWLVVQWFAILAADALGLPDHLATIAASLLSAWVVIRLAAHLITNPALSRSFAVVAWSMAALTTLGLLNPTLALLDRMAINIGDVNLSLLTVIKALLSVALLLWLAAGCANLLERRLQNSPTLSPSMKVLTAKLGRIVLVAVALVFGLDAVGIDLTAFAVFSGALGVGIGFGLQKIVSNLISGFILLLDKSVKPGDVIAVGETYGWIEALGARYTSVVTRDGIEHLIPNEELITTRVENWSHSFSQVRLRIPVGVHYNSDVRLAIRLCLEAASSVPRVLKNPAAVCLLKGFGDSSVDLEVRIWVNDPQNGCSNVRSEVMLRIWDLFHEHGIEIPYPQRDLHIRSAEGLSTAAGQRPGPSDEAA